MAEPNSDNWALTHMRLMALSRWDNEGGASAFRPTAGLGECTQARRRNQGPRVSPVPVRSVAVVHRRFSETIQSAKRAGPARARPG